MALEPRKKPIYKRILNRILPPSSNPTGSSAVPPTAAPPANPADTHGEAWNVVRDGLETTLRLLERSADAFPPLKSTVGGLLGCLEVIQVSYCSWFSIIDIIWVAFQATAANDEYYGKLASEIERMQMMLRRSATELDPTDQSGILM
jgi:hypothetical protein